MSKSNTYWLHIRKNWYWYVVCVGALAGMTVLRTYFGCTETTPKVHTECVILDIGLIIGGSVMSALISTGMNFHTKLHRINIMGEDPHSKLKTSDKNKRLSSNTGQNPNDVEIGRTLDKWMYALALITVLSTLAIAVTYKPVGQTATLEPGTQFVAAATIMGFAVFGSALAIPSQHKGMLRSIAYALVAFVTVQAVFMATLVSNFNMPTVWWVAMTAIWLLLLVLVMTANRFQPDGVCGDAGLAR